MSEFSQPLSTCSRTTDFSFCFNNSAFSDAVLVVLTLRPKGASIPWRLASSVAQLFVSAVEVSATTLTATVPVAESSSWFAAGKALGSLGQTVVSRLSPKDGQEVAISTVYQVNSALLAASSPYLRHLIQHPPQLQALVPGLASVAARHRPRKLVTVLIQPHHVAAAEAVVRFIFTNDIALTSAQQALDALLVAEQLQVPDCAEVCQHYLEDCSMDWPVALTLVHLQHKHQQEQEQLRQQQQQQHQGSGTLHKASSGPGSASVSGRRSSQQQRPSLHSRHSLSSGLKGRGVAGACGLDAVTPLLPVPSESVYLQGLLLCAQDFLVQQFEDLELVLATPEGRGRLLLLPYDALRAILGHPRLKVASENTALLAAAGWLQANAAQASSLLLSPDFGSSGSGKVVGLGHLQQQGLDDARVQTVYSSALYSASSSGGLEGAAAGSAAAAIADGTAESAKQNGVAAGAAASSLQQQGAAAASTQLLGGQRHQGASTASGPCSLLLDLCQVLRLCQCSYTYVLHVLPQLPLFRDQPQLVAALQFEVMRFRAAGKLRQRRLAAEACAAAAAAATSSLAPCGAAVASNINGLHQQQQQVVQLQQPRKGVAGGSGSDGSMDSAKDPAAAAAAAAGGLPWAAGPTGAAGGQGWRTGCTVDAALLQCQPRPESARSTLEFSFTFDPQLLSGQEQKGSGAGDGSSGGGGSSSNGGSSGGQLDLMQRLLGLSPQQQADASVVSEDQYFAGYVWNLVAAADGFVGVSWRVVLPGGVDVGLPGPHSAAGQASRAAGASGSSTLRLFGPDCAGFRSPEVAVTFSITSSGLHKAQRNSSSNGNLGAAAAGNSSGSVAVTSGAGSVDAAVVKPGSRTDQQVQQGGSSVTGGSPLKGSSSSKSAVVGRAYSEVQFVPAHCAWGFPDFAGAGGWDPLKGPDGKVCLRCQLRHRE